MCVWYNENSWLCVCMVRKGLLRLESGFAVVVDRAGGCICYTHLRNWLVGSPLFSPPPSPITGTPVNVVHWPTLAAARSRDTTHTHTTTTKHTYIPSVILPLLVTRVYIQGGEHHRCSLIWWATHFFFNISPILYFIYIIYPCILTSTHLSSRFLV